MSKMTAEELKKLEASSTYEDLCANVDAVKADHGGDYPEDWYEKMLATGLLELLASGLGKPGATTIVVV